MRVTKTAMLNFLVMGRILIVVDRQRLMDLPDVQGEAEDAASRIPATTVDRNPHVATTGTTRVTGTAHVVMICNPLSCFVMTGTSSAMPVPYVAMPELLRSTTGIVPAHVVMTVPPASRRRSVLPRYHLGAATQYAAV